MTSFDLIHEPWIPVIDQGMRREVSLLDALLGAHELDGLALDDPLQTVAILRQVLLPVLIDATGLPRSDREWADRWRREHLDAESIRAYLDEYADRFDLFHPSQPFGQVAGLRTAKGETKPVSLLMPAIATGNNVPLFAGRTEANPPALAPAEAARAVLAAHCWDHAAIKSGAVGDANVRQGKTTGNPVSPVGQLGTIIPMGATLAQTLLLNIPIRPQGLRPGDRPQWRSEPAATAQWTTRSAAGLLDLLTWQARRIRLVPHDADNDVLVQQVVLAAGDRLQVIPHDLEPHTAWQRIDKPKAGQPPNRPIRHLPGREAWRGMAALLATRGSVSTGASAAVSSSLLLTQIADLRADARLPSDLPLQVLTVGVVYGNQQAVVEDVVVDLMPLPVAALPQDSAARHLLVRLAGEADSLRVAANDLGDQLRLAGGASEKLPWDKGQRIGDALVHEFTPVVRRLLAGLQREPDRVHDAEDAWRATAWRLSLAAAKPVLDAAGPRAFLGREANEKWAYRLSLAEDRYRWKVTTILGYSPADQIHNDAVAGAVR